MNKKLLAVAVAGAFAAPALALAQNSTVQIYGTLNAEYGFAKGFQESAGRTNSWDGLNSGASSLGFKGEEKLGGGMSAFFQCESDLGFLKGDQGTTAAALATQPGFCGRNSAVGLKGGFGSFFIGTWDSPTKQAVAAHRIAGETGWHGVQSFLISGGGAFTGSFSVRNSNSLNYNSPKFGGFSFKAQTTSTKAASTVQTAGLKGRHTSLSADYSAGPLAVTAAYSTADDNRSAAAATGTDMSSVVLGGSYTFGKAKLALMYIDSSSDVSTTEELKRKSWNIGGTYDLAGPGSIFAAYTVAGDTKTNNASTAVANTGANTGGKTYQIGYRHSLSKRTFAGLSYVRAKNDSNAIGYSVGAQGTALTAGASSSVVVMQLNHKF